MDSNKHINITSSKVGTLRSRIMNLAEAIDHIRPRIVQIGFSPTILSEEERSRARSVRHSPLGTGFIVSPDGYVITAGHVFQNIPEAKIRIGFAIPNIENMRGNFILVDCDIVDRDERHDMALLKLGKNPFKGEVRSGYVIQDKEVPILYGLATLDTNRPRDGETIGISGYPLGEPVLVTNAGWMATSWAFKIDVYATPIPGAPQWFQLPDVADVYLADVEVNPGNSGAPVYLVESAEVIGMCVSSKPAPVRDQKGEIVKIDGQCLYYSSGLTHVVPSRYIVEILKKNGLG